MTSLPQDERDVALRRRHLAIGWIALLCFALLGIALEALHAWKSDAYLHPAHETRRLLLRLAHAHGVGLALLHVAFAATLAFVPRVPKFVGACFTGASLAMPLGFLLGGLGNQGGDPGAGIALVPVGALLLVLGVGATARACLRRDG